MSHPTITTANVIQLNKTSQYHKLLRKLHRLHHPLKKRRSPSCSLLVSMAVTSLSLSWVPTNLKGKFQLNMAHAAEFPRVNTFCVNNNITSTGETTINEESQCKRRPLLLGLGLMTANLSPVTSLHAEEVPKNYKAFVDFTDGYAYYYPSDWREFDFRGHDSAFKDRYLQLQNVRVRFIPTNKMDIRDMGTMEEVIPDLVAKVYAAPNQVAKIFDMQEKTVDGKNYYTFEYELKSPNFASTAFATIAVANGRYYTLIVGANERRWRRVRNKLKVVADSFKVFDI